jgi:hypothetical protein
MKEKPFVYQGIKIKNQKELFDYIWSVRPHVSELSGKPLLPVGNMRWHHQFLHVLGKGTYPKWRLNPENIMLALPEEHVNQERYLVFMDRQDELRREYYREFYNKEF